MQARLHIIRGKQRTVTLVRPLQIRGSMSGFAEQPANIADKQIARSSRSDATLRGALLFFSRISQYLARAIPVREDPEQ
jgi:hypothetical protein